MEQGDLIYIPEATRLFSTQGVSHTERPRIGIFIRKEDHRHSIIFMEGARLHVDTRHIYSLLGPDNVS